MSEQNHQFSTLYIFRCLQRIGECNVLLVEQRALNRKILGSISGCRVGSLSKTSVLHRVLINADEEVALSRHD